MKKKTRFLVVSMSEEGLAREVQKAERKGWRCFGPSIQDGPRFCQPMLRIKISPLTND